MKTDSMNSGVVQESFEESGDLLEYESSKEETKNRGNLISLYFCIIFYNSSNVLYF